MFHVSYEIVTEESAEYGDAQERGVISDNVSLRDALEDLLSARANVSSIEANDSLDPYWITVYYDMDLAYGHYENRSLHMPRSLTLSTRKRIERIVKAC
jgi:hypothetical protein